MRNKREDPERLPKARTRTRGGKKGQQRSEATRASESWCLQVPREAGSQKGRQQIAIASIIPLPIEMEHKRRLKKEKRAYSSRRGREPKGVSFSYQSPFKNFGFRVIIGITRAKHFSNTTDGLNSNFFNIYFDKRSRICYN